MDTRVKMLHIYCGASSWGDLKTMILELTSNWFIYGLPPRFLIKGRRGEARLLPFTMRTA